MNCKQLMRELTDYLDGQLDPAVVKTLEQHLSDCDDCHIVVDTTRKTIELYCNCQPLPLPLDVRQRLDRALAQKLGQKPD
ncbi:MAG: anti-sigma factor family protein [Terriglobia bacterium]